MEKLLPLQPIINNILAIQVTYRRTSRLSMRIVKNGDVHVSAPIGLSRDRVMAFIEEHREWIDEARKKTLERQRQRSAFYDKLPLTTRAQADEALRRLKAIVEPMVERHAREMGVSPSRIYYKPTISRWGQHLHLGLRAIVARVVHRAYRGARAMSPPGAEPQRPFPRPHGPVFPSLARGPQRDAQGVAAGQIS